MIENLNFENILFLDIETIPAWSSYAEMPERFQKLWDSKAQKISKNEEETAEIIFPRAGIYAEFGRIICISVAYVKDKIVRVRSFYGEDEKELLQEFSVMVSKYFNSKDHLLCAHNGKEFDFPYIARRMVINGLTIPDIFNSSGRKPWEIRHLDTMELWKFGDYKHYTSLDLLTAVFDIPSPKDDISGADVWKVFWIEKDLERIKNYCQKDVVTIVQLMCRYQNMPLFLEENIVYK